MMWVTRDVTARFDPPLSNGAGLILPRPHMNNIGRKTLKVMPTLATDCLLVLA
jgi:hypothetical protein